MSTFSDRSLEDTLERCFSYKSFRLGQRAIVEAALEKRDSCVYWATGKGKSLCFQVPALHSGQMTLVVSPLISLMRDQVINVNETVGPDTATFLGSGQSDHSAEERALRGDFLIVYVSPEKLIGDSDGNFLRRLQELHSRKPIGLLAIDEAHCASAWGHDFRPQYSKLGRFRDILPDIPIMALTATAVPRVREDISTSLALRNPRIAISSFLRPNLNITVTRKGTAGGISSHLRPLVDSLLHRPVPTIVFCRSQADTMNAADAIRNMLQGLQKDKDGKDGKDGKSGGTVPVVVQPYHAGLPKEHLDSVHRGFLTDQVTVVTATVAFAMGIDKPDIRRVVHYGAPSGVETYYQQIGRAGRDGLVSECELLYSDADFAGYNSDFYTGKLTSEAKQAFLHSLEGLRMYSSTEGCRHQQLLSFFQEQWTPVGGDADGVCGACDNCSAKLAHAGDTERDYTTEAQVILAVAQASEKWPLATGAFIRVLRLQGPDGNKEAFGSLKQAMDASAAVQMVLDTPLGHSDAAWKDLLSSLCNKNMIARKAQNAGFASYDTIICTPRGREILKSCGQRIMLNVPKAVREIEAKVEIKKKKDEERAQNLKEQLIALGLDADSLPPVELRERRGEHIAPMLAFLNKLERITSPGPEHGPGHELADAAIEKKTKILDLMQRLKNVRTSLAVERGLAPSGIFSDSQCCSILLSFATSAEALGALNCRIGIERIGATVMQWKEENPGFFPAGSTSSSASVSAIDRDREGCLPDDISFPMLFDGTNGSASPPLSKWPMAVYKAKKGSDPRPMWEVSFDRYMKGDGLETIAVTQSSGKPVLASTIYGHILTAITQGRGDRLNLAKLFGDACTAGINLPDKSDWEKISDALQHADIDVQDPAFQRKSALTAILGPSVEEDFATKSIAQQGEERFWYQKVDVFTCLNRAKWVPKWGGDEGHNRGADSQDRKRTKQE